MHVTFFVNGTFNGCTKENAAIEVKRIPERSFCVCPSSPLPEAGALGPRSHMRRHRTPSAAPRHRSRRAATAAASHHPRTHAQRSARVASIGGSAKSPRPFQCRFLSFQTSAKARYHTLNGLHPQTLAPKEYSRVQGRSSLAWPEYIWMPRAVRVLIPVWQTIGMWGVWATDHTDYRSGLLKPLQRDQEDLDS